MPEPRPAPTLSCARSACGDPIPEKRARNRGARYCSETCKRAELADRYKAANPSDGPRLPAATVATLAVHAVAADLTRRGFDVYVALSPAQSIDMLLVRGERVLRVEVYSAARSATGAPMFVRRGGGDRVPGELVALHFRDGSIEYRPKDPADA